MDLPWLVYKLVFGTDRAELKRRRTQGLLNNATMTGNQPGAGPAGGNVTSGGQLYPAHPDYESNPRARRRSTGAALNEQRRGQQTKDHVVVRRLSGSFEVW